MLIVTIIVRLDELLPMADKGESLVILRRNSCTELFKTREFDILTIRAFATFPLA